MMGLLYRPKWFGTPLRLESVKKTHQVARVGMGPHPSRLLPAWEAISAERGVNRGFRRRAVCSISTATRHHPSIFFARLGYFPDQGPRNKTPGDAGCGLAWSRR